MHLVPIPTTEEHVERSARHWAPFLPGVSRYSKEPLECIVNSILNLETQVILAWDGERAQAAVGVCYHLRGNEKIGRLIWFAGGNADLRKELLPDLERYLKDMGCAEVQPVCRRGLQPLFKEAGYKLTHVVMEKTL